MCLDINDVSLGLSPKDRDIVAPHGLSSFFETKTRKILEL